MLASLERAREAEHRFVGRRLARAAHAAHRAARQRRLRRRATAPIPPCSPTSRPTRRAWAALLDDLLALAREDAAAPVRGEPVDLVELAREAAAPTRRGGRRRRGPGIVHGERPALERAVGNLVRNARRHGPPGGRVTRDGGRRVDQRRGRGPGPARSRARVRALLARGRRGLRARPGDRRARSPSATAAASTSAGRASHWLSRSCQRSPVQLRPSPQRRTLAHETTPLTAPLHSPRASLAAAVVALAVGAVGIAQAVGGGSTPPPKPLAQAVYDAARAPDAARHHARASTSPTTCSPPARCREGTGVAGAHRRRRAPVAHRRRPPAARAAVRRRRRADRLRRHGASASTTPTSNTVYTRRAARAAARRAPSRNARRRSTP